MMNIESFKFKGGIFQQIRAEISFERMFESDIRKQREILLGVIETTDKVIDLLDVEYQSSFDGWDKYTQRHNESRAVRLMGSKIFDIWEIIPERVERVNVGGDKYYKNPNNIDKEMLVTWDSKTINDYCRKSIESLPGGGGFFYWAKKAIRRDI